MPLTSRLGRGSAAYLALLLSGCTASPEPGAYVTLADTTRLVGAPLVLRPTSPMAANDDENMICFTLASGDTLRDDWSIAVASAGPVQLHAEVTLGDGRTLPLPTQSTLGASQYCLGPRVGGPLPAAVREARVWSSAPITLSSIEWLSTHK